MLKKTTGFSMILASVVASSAVLGVLLFLEVSRWIAYPSAFIAVPATFWAISRLVRQGRG